MAKRNSQKLASAKQSAFLAAYAEVGTLTHAADAAACDISSHYYWMENDADYPQKFREAQERAADNLEREARRRAVEGVRRYKFHQGEHIMTRCDPDDPECVATAETDGGETVGLRPYYEHEYSNQLLTMLIKAARPERFKDRVDHKHDHEHAGSIQVHHTRDQLHGRIKDRMDELLANGTLLPSDN